MNIFIYCIIGIVGILFGSFFTLSVYRIPLGEDIVHTRSYCPKCKHKLNFLDLIPVLSYIFLGGKCRYCKSAISKRYILFELFTGILFVLLALSMGITINNIISLLPILIYNILFLAIIIMLIGMAKEANVINISTVLFGILFRITYLVFFDIQNFKGIFLHATELLIICLITYVIMSLMKVENNKFFELSLVVCLIAYNFGLGLTLIIMILAIISELINKYLFKKKINIVLYLGVISIIVLITSNIDVANSIYMSINNLII